MGLQLRWLPRLLRFKYPFQKPAAEAADQYLGKSAKVQTLNDLTMARDLQELAEADRAKVNLLHKKHGMDLRGDKSSGDRDTWACDDMTINAGGGSRLLELLLLAGLAFMAFLHFGKQTPQAPVSVNDTEYEVRFYDKDGNQITVPRIAPK